MKQFLKDLKILKDNPVIFIFALMLTGVLMLPLWVLL